MNILKKIIVPEPEDINGRIAIFYDSFPYCVSQSEIKPDSVKQSHCELLSKKDDGRIRLNEKSVIFYFRDGSKFRFHLDENAFQDQVQQVAELVERKGKNGLQVLNHFAKLKAKSA